MSAAPVSAPAAPASSPASGSPDVRRGSRLRRLLRGVGLVAAGLAGLGLLLVLALGHEDHPRNGPQLGHAPEPPLLLSATASARAGHAEVVTATLTATTLALDVRVTLPRAGTYYAYAELEGPLAASREQSFSRRRWFASKSGPATARLIFAAGKNGIGGFNSELASSHFLRNFSVKNVDRHPSQPIVTSASLPIPGRVFIESAPERSRDEETPAHKSLTGTAPQI